MIAPHSIPDPDALLVALVLAPGTFSRNKFFDMFQEHQLLRARRRAGLIRALIKDLTDPWPHPGEIPSHPAPVIEREEEKDGELHLVYRIDELDFRRSAVLTKIEAAALRYALHRAGKRPLEPADRALVEACLAKMNPIS